MARDNWLAPIEMYLKHKWNCFMQIALNGCVDIHMGVARDNWLAPIEMYLKHKWNCFMQIALNGCVDIHMGYGRGVIESIQS